MIVIKDLIFAYPGHLALDGIHLTIESGSITALIGPNGSGKTTLLRCLAGLCRPTSGKIYIKGSDLEKRPNQCKRLIGYLGDFLGLYDHLSVQQALEYFARAYGLDNHRIQTRISFLLEKLHLTEKQKKAVGSLSRGMKQRLAIGQAIIHNPEILILDEPASGLDPEARIHLGNLFKDLNRSGMTILVSSHILAELDAYANRLIIIQKGHIKSHSNLNPREKNYQKLIIKSIADPEILYRELNRMDQFKNIQKTDDYFSGDFYGSDFEKAQCLRQLLESGLAIYEFSQQKANIQQEYLNIIQENEI